MKKLIISFLFLIILYHNGHTQGNTNYGTGSGASGADNSFFGNSAGSASGSSSSKNVAAGSSALSNNVSGDKTTTVGFESSQHNGAEENTALGYRSLRSSSAGHNAAFGYEAMTLTPEVEDNTAFGSFALRSDTINNNINGGNDNVTVGYGTLAYAKSVSENTVAGYQAHGREKSLIVTGRANVAIGRESLSNCEDCSELVAIGYRALYNISNFASGGEAMGSYALSNLSTPYNTAFGFQALYQFTEGYGNCAIGCYALSNCNYSRNNTAIGSGALHNLTRANPGDPDDNIISNNVAIGFAALFTNQGNHNTGIGYYTIISDDEYNSIAIGANAACTASNQARIGNTQVTSIGGYAPWSNFSDGRFKTDIKEDVAGLEFINMLRPVSYVVDKNGLDKFIGIPDSIISRHPSGRLEQERETGFIAQEVEKVIKKTGVVFSGVGIPENENDHYTLQYSQFVVPLVKAVQQLAGQYEELNVGIQEQDKEIEEQQLQIEMLLKVASEKQARTTNENNKSSAYLIGNDPNPFTQQTHIKMVVPEQTQTATVIIADLGGKRVKTISVSKRGETEIVISGSELNAGMYLYYLVADGQITDVKRMILTE